MILDLSLGSTINLVNLWRTEWPSSDQLGLRPNKVSCTNYYVSPAHDINMQIKKNYREFGSWIKKDVSLSKINHVSEFPLHSE